MDIRNLT